MHTIVISTGLVSFIVFVWLPVALLFHSIVNTDAAAFKSTAKHVFYVLLALPFAWITEVTALVGYALKKLPALSKLAAWFKG